MKVKAHMLAFGGGKIREIDIPNEEISQGDGADEYLDLAFKYGQNDFQPKPFPSVSVGDVIELSDGSLHRVEGCGFTRIESL